MLDDLQRRALVFGCRVWVYRDPTGQPVGFGTLDVSTDCGEFTGGRPHTYIPLLAENPTIPSLGYGTSIVAHLIREATLLALDPARCVDRLFLDVYTTSTRAVALYTKCGFVPVTPEPIADPDAGGATYLVMARSVAVAAG